MSLARRILFRLDPVAANVFERLMMRFDLLNRKSSSKEQFCYAKSVFLLINGDDTDGKGNQHLSVYDAPINKAFQVRTQFFLLNLVVFCFFLTNF